MIAESTASGSGQRPFYDFLESCLRHKAELVIFEAARAIVAMPEVTNRELAPAITVLQLFLTSSKPVLRFASVRTLNKVRLPSLYSPCTRLWEDDTPAFCLPISMQHEVCGSGAAAGCTCGACGRQGFSTHVVDDEGRFSAVPGQYVDQRLQGWASR